MLRYHPIIKEFLFARNRFSKEKISALKKSGNYLPNEEMTMTEWNALEHSKGKAADIPKFINVLAGKVKVSDEYGPLEDPTNEYEARLYRALISPGKWFSASAPSAELLLGIAEGDGRGAYRALGLLGELACGEHRDWIASGFGAKRPPAEFAAETRQVVLKGFSNALKKLRHKEWPMRAAAAFLLGCLPEHADENRAELAGLLKDESSPYVRANAVMSLGVLSAAAGRPARELDAFMNETEHPLTQGMAAMGLVLSRAADPGDVSGELAQLVKAADRSHFNTTEEVRWGRREAGDLLVACARNLGGELSSRIVDVLIAEFERDPKRWTYNRYLDPILELSGFKQKWPEERMTALPEELTERQREVARGIARCGNILCQGWGLPADIRIIPRWLGDAPPSVLEERVEIMIDGQPASRPRWWVWRQAKDRKEGLEEIDAYVQRLALPARLPLMADCSENGYRLIRMVPSLDVDLADLAGEVEGDGRWAIEWADDLMKCRWADTPTGPLCTLNTDVRTAVWRILLDKGLPLRPEWVGLTPFFFRNEAVWSVLERMPVDMRHEGTLRNLNYQGSDLTDGVVARLDLFASRPIIERLLALSTPKADPNGLDEEEAAEAKKAIRKLGAERPEVAQWAREWEADWKRKSEPQTEKTAPKKASPKAAAKPTARKKK
jgi:hypothetical protein